MFQQGGALAGNDQPVVQIPMQADSSCMSQGGHSGHDPGEHVRSRGQAEAQRAELIDLTEPCKPQEGSGIHMDGYLEVGVLEVDRKHPIEWVDRLDHSTRGLHMKLLFGDPMV